MADFAASSVHLPLLVGREREQAVLRGHLAAAVEGHGSLVIIAGEAGIGKSRLVADATEHAITHDFHVLRGSCFEPDRSLPYAPLLDLLRNHLLAHARENPGYDFGVAAPELVKLLPELAADRPDRAATPLEPDQEKRRLFHALTAWILRRAVDYPLLVIVEDLHWSDDTSLEFLLALVRRIIAEPALLVLTYRDDEIHPALAQFLAALDRERLATELPLARLTPPEVGAMLHVLSGRATPVRRDFLAAVYALTEGNPFFIEEIVKSLPSASDRPDSNSGWNASGSPGEFRIPRSVQVAVQHRVERLSPAARHVLLLAAVAGRRFDFRLLQALTAHDEHDLLRTIKELIAAQLVVEESVDTFAFRHALTRQAIYSELLARERRSLHHTIAETIERLNAGSLDAHLAELAYHYHEAGAWAEALEYSRRVGERAQALDAPRAAIDHFTRALGAAHHLAQSPSLSLYRSRGLAYETLGEFDQAGADLDTALRIAHDDDDRQMEWRSLMDLGSLWAGRDYQRAGEFFRRAADRARTMDTPLVYARSLNRLANWLVNIGQTAEGLPLHYEALAIFEQEADVEGRAETLDLLGMANGIAGDVIRGVAHYDDAIALFRTLDNIPILSSSLASRVAYASPIFVETTPGVLGAMEDAARAAAEALALARKIDWAAGQAYAEWTAAAMFASYGEFGAARAHGESAVRLATEIAHQQWIVAAYWALGQSDLLMCAPHAAIEHLEVALPLARALGSAWWIGNITAYLAQAYLLSHEERQAEIALAAAMPRDQEPRNAAERRLAWAWGEMTLATGDAARALAIAERLIASAPGMANLRPIPWLGKLRGEALAALHRFDEAASVLEEAQRAAAEQGARPLLWQIHRALGRVHRQCKAEDRATRAFAAARAIIASLAETIADATLREQFCRAALDTLPRERQRTPRQIAAAEYGGLTAREREVAVLIAQSKSNREIADALVVSEWTIDTHVGHILSKLGFTSRVQVARWVVERGLSGDAGR